MDPLPKEEALKRFGVILRRNDFGLAFVEEGPSGFFPHRTNIHRFLQPTDMLDFIAAIS